MGKGLEPISMQMSGGHLLAAGLDGGNSIIFTEGENVIKSRLAENIYSVGCTQKSASFARRLPIFTYYLFTIHSSQKMRTDFWEVKSNNE